MLTLEEAPARNPLAHARKAPHRLVQRAQIIWASAPGRNAPAIAPQVGRSALRVRAWSPRFNRQGLAGLADAARPGRPRRHDETARSTVMALARTTPRRLGSPFELWPLARLQRAIQARGGRQVAQGTIWKWLQAEGVVWKRQQRWFQVTVDAAFLEKRGPSSRPTRSRSQAAGSAASMSWAP
jgi:transposase